MEKIQGVVLKYDSLIEIILKFRKKIGVVIYNIMRKKKERNN